MTAARKGLVERLLRKAHNDGGNYWYVNPDGPEAATEIERLQALLAPAPIEARELLANLRGFTDMIRSEVEQDREDGHYAAADMRERRAVELDQAIDFITRALQGSAGMGEAEFRDAAQIAFDAQSDDPQPGDWNAACLHIAEEIRALSPQADRLDQGEEG